MKNVIYLFLMIVVQLVTINFNTVGPNDELELSNNSNVLWLPFISKQDGILGIGVKMNQPPSDKEFVKIKELGISWDRKDLSWSRVEVNEGTYFWDNIRDLENEIIWNNTSGINTILIIQQTPLWARLYPDCNNGPIKPDKYNAFGEFLYQVVMRYSKPPYNVLYYEIWNEPDVDPAIYNYSGSGCGKWGNLNDQFYGGGEYAAMLRIVYPKMKQANPNIKVLIGALLLDCDPRGSPSWCDKIGHSSKPPKFLEGILANGGKDYFDGVAYNSYEQYRWILGLGSYYTANFGSSNLSHTIAFKKAEYINELLRKYDANDKFMINTENGLICIPTDRPECSSVDFEITKSYYIIQSLLELGSLSQVRSTIWYKSTGWRHTHLITSEGIPVEPGYRTFGFMNNLFRGSSEIRLITQYPYIRYDLQNNDHAVSVVWSPNGQSIDLELPNPVMIISMNSNNYIESSRIMITREPLFIYWK